MMLETLRRLGQGPRLWRGYPPHLSSLPRSSAALPLVYEVLLGVLFILSQKSTFSVSNALIALSNAHCTLGQLHISLAAEATLVIERIR